VFFLNTVYIASWIGRRQVVLSRLD